MSGIEGAACVGKWWLFDSVDLIDHAEAAAICAGCPARRRCLEALHAEAAVYPAGTPCGTWAGKLVGTSRLPREHGTERGWGQHRHNREKACDPCKCAHVRYVETGKSGRKVPL